MSRVRRDVTILACEPNLRVTPSVQPLVVDRRLAGVSVCGTGVRAGRSSGWIGWDFSAISLDFPAVCAARAGVIGGAGRGEESVRVDDSKLDFGSGFG